MTSAITLADGATRDLGEIMQVMEDAFDPAFGEAWSAAQCAGVMGMPGVWLTVARAGARLTGFALSRHVLDEAELLLIAVDPVHRGLGIGRALLSQVFADAARRGALRLHLEMRAGNPASRLYTSTGFVEIGRRKAYYRGRDGQAYDAQTLSRDLVASKPDET